MALVSETFTGDEKEFTVTDQGLKITLASGYSTKLKLRADVANASLVQYAMNNSALVDGAVAADDAAVKAAGYHYLDAGDGKDRENLNLKILYMRSPTGISNKVKVSFA